MGTYSDMLFGGQLEEVQAPIERPAPIRRPGEAAPAPRPRTAAPAAAAPMPAQDAPVVDYWSKYEAKPPAAAAPSPTEPAPPPARRYSDDLFGAGPAEAPAAPQARNPASLDPNAEPDAPTWMGRRVQDVVGKQDPRYKGIPTMVEALKAEGGLTAGTAASEGWSWLVGAEDKDLGKTYASWLGKRFVRQEQDANGAEIIVYKGKDGQEAKAYVNRPGLDLTDTLRGAASILPNVAAGGMVGGAMRGAALIPRMVGQAIGQGGASAAQDASGAVTGVTEFDLDKSAIKAGVSAIGGAGGEVIGQAGSYIWRRLVTEPRLFNAAKGELTEAGMRAAQEAGLDPKLMARDIQMSFSKALAKTGNVDDAVRQVTDEEIPIRVSKGERTGDREQLLREQQARGGLYGSQGRETIEKFDDLQRQDIKNVVMGEIAPGKPGIAGQIAPDRIGQDLGKDTLGSNIRANTQKAFDTAKEFEKRAWKDVGEFIANDEVRASMRPIIESGLYRRNINFIEEKLTPAAMKMSALLDDFEAGAAPTAASSFVKGPKTGDVDLFRRRLLAAKEEAVTDTDKRAADAIYKTFNDDWIPEAAKMAGDPTIATNLMIARDITKTLHQIFDGQPGTAASNMMKTVLKGADTPENVINALYSMPGKSEIKNGASVALDQLIAGYRKFLPPDEATAAINDLSLAFWMRTVGHKTGEMQGPQALSTAIKSMLNNQATLADKLLLPEQRAALARMAGRLDQVAKKNPNTSWSAIGIGAMLKDLGNAVVTMFGINSRMGKMAIDTIGAPVKRAYGNQVVRDATGNMLGAQAPRALPPPLAGPAGGIAGQTEK